MRNSFRFVFIYSRKIGFYHRELKEISCDSFEIIDIIAFFLNVIPSTSVIPLLDEEGLEYITAKEVAAA